MAQPSSRQELIDYCKRQLGAPVLEINVADEQVEDLMDDALQYFHERHFDGVTQTYLKYKITQDDVDRGRGKVGIVTTTGTASIGGSSITFDFEENSNYLQVPPSVIGVNKIFKFDGTNTITNNMFSVKYQLFLNDIYFWGSTELLTYAMTKTYLEDIDFLLSTDKQIRFNQRMDRLYLDIDWGSASVDDYIVIEEIGHSTDIYEGGKKFRVIDKKEGMFVLEGDIKPNTSKILRWCLGKDDVTPQDIFKLSNEGPEGRAIVGKYFGLNNIPTS